MLNDYLIQCRGQGIDHNTLEQVLIKFGQLHRRLYCVPSETAQLYTDERGCTLRMFHLQITSCPSHTGEELLALLKTNGPASRFGTNHGPSDLVGGRDEMEMELVTSESEEEEEEEEETPNRERSCNLLASNIGPLAERPIQDLRASRQNNIRAAMEQQCVGPLVGCWIVLQLEGDQQLRHCVVVHNTGRTFFLAPCTDGSKLYEIDHEHMHEFLQRYFQGHDHLLNKASASKPAGKSWVSETVTSRCSYLQYLTSTHELRLAATTAQKYHLLEQSGSPEVRLQYIRTEGRYFGGRIAARDRCYQVGAAPAAGKIADGGVRYDLEAALARFDGAPCAAAPPSEGRPQACQGITVIFVPDVAVYRDIGPSPRRRNTSEHALNMRQRADGTSTSEAFNNGLRLHLANRNLRFNHHYFSEARKS